MSIFSNKYHIPDARPAWSASHLDYLQVFIHRKILGGFKIILISDKLSDCIEKNENKKIFNIDIFQTKPVLQRGGETMMRIRTVREAAMAGILQVLKLVFTKMKQ